MLIVIDTLRADALGPANTPTLDALAARGEAATLAWSGGTWTVPSVISLFTGAPVRQHGWDGPTGQQGRYPKLPALPTLAETFRAAGFTTIGLYANGYLAEEHGFDRGFDVWRRVPDAAMHKALAETLAALPPDPDRRHLLYLHLLGPHSTLRPSEEAAARHGVTEAVTAAGKQGLDIGAVARALSANPEMLLLDEATSALDPLVADGVVALFGRLQRERGLSLLFITHDLALARRAAHRIAVMEAGRIVECAPREELFANPQADATKRLIAASG